MLEQTKKNLYKKIAKVILHENTQTIAKNPQGYSADDVLAQLRGAMAENNLVCMVSFPEYKEETKNNWVKFLFTLVDADSGECEEYIWHQIIPTPNGRMSIDKCVGAASTYAHKYFLMRTFMLTSKDNPSIDPPSGNGGNSKPASKQTNNKQKKQPKGSTQDQSALSMLGRGSYRKDIALSHSIKDVYKFVLDTSVEGQQLKRWDAYCKIDGQDYPFKVWQDKVALIDSVLGLETGTMEARLDDYMDEYETKTYPCPTPISVMTDWYKGNAVMASAIEDFRNPAVKKAFFDHHKDLSPDVLKEALGVENSADYKGTLAMAMQAVADYLKKQKTISPAFKNSVEKVKQERLIDSPRVEELG